MVFSKKIALIAIMLSSFLQSAPKVAVHNNNNRDKWSFCKGLKYAVIGTAVFLTALIGHDICEIESTIAVAHNLADELNSCVKTTCDSADSNKCYKTCASELFLLNDPVRPNRKMRPKPRAYRKTRGSDYESCLRDTDASEKSCAQEAATFNNGDLKWLIATPECIFYCLPEFSPRILLNEGYGDFRMQQIDKSKK